MIGVTLAGGRLVSERNVRSRGKHMQGSEAPAMVNKCLCYTAQAMKWTLVVMLTASLALARNGHASDPRQPLGQTDSSARQSELRRQGNDALLREQARTKQELCADAEKRGNAEIGECFQQQFKTTEQDYLAYVHAIGALLRLPSSDETASSIHGRLPFDSAEDAWLKYRDASCRSMATQWEGSQSSVAFADCRIKLTRNHMNELADLYTDLWH